MTGPTKPPIFDGHNDLLARLHLSGGVAAAETFVTGRDGHLDLDRCRKGGFAGGLFAVFVPSVAAKGARRSSRQQATLPDLRRATEVVEDQIDILARLEALGALRLCRTTADIRACLDEGTLSAVLHIEGAEAIDADLAALETLHRRGLRSLGPMWSRPNRFGHGAPLGPNDADTGPGLTELGLELVRRCNRLGIAVDVSHLNAAGFWDVVRVTERPLVATHSNAHAISPQARNLTDRQLAAIRERGGLVGVNFSLALLRADGRMADAGLDLVLRHLDHLITHLGEDGVGLGSDFDGAPVPSAIGSAAGLPALRQAMAEHGYDGGLMEKLCFRNWLRVLDRIWRG